MSRLAKVEKTLRTQALSYPGTYEEFPWGHRALKVKGKAFVFLTYEHHALSLSVKLPISHPEALMMPFAEPTHYGLGKSGWVTASFGESDEVPLEMVGGWIDESYRAIAPKKLLAELTSASGVDRQRPLREAPPQTPPVAASRSERGAAPGASMAPPTGRAKRSTGTTSKRPAGSKSKRE